LFPTAIKISAQSRGTPFHNFVLLADYMVAEKGCKKKGKKNQPT
jgi:hypothetical protein